MLRWIGMCSEGDGSDEDENMNMLRSGTQMRL